MTITKVTELKGTRENLEDAIFNATTEINDNMNGENNTLSFTIEDDSAETVFEYDSSTQQIFMNAQTYVNFFNSLNRG